MADRAETQSNKEQDPKKSAGKLSLLLKLHFLVTNDDIRENVTIPALRIPLLAAAAFVDAKIPETEEGAETNPVLQKIKTAAQQIEEILTPDATKESENRAAEQLVIDKKTLKDGIPLLIKKLNDELVDGKDPKVRQAADTFTRDDRQGEKKNQPKTKSNKQGGQRQESRQRGPATRAQTKR